MACIRGPLGAHAVASGGKLSRGCCAKQSVPHGGAIEQPFQLDAWQGVFEVTGIYAELPWGHVSPLAIMQAAERGRS
jgi:hypothetical protein